MLDRFFADAIVVVHLLFVIYAIFGGVLVLRWKYTVYSHIPALLWGIAVEANGWICPLTPLENELRARAGLVGYTGGFVEHYLLPVLYLDNLTRYDQYVLAALLILVNVVVYAFVIRKHGWLIKNSMR
ncbi:DUF2784 domain-containing protein [Gammaproteobacteria bacterium]|nr:DUF2784 domain-containing protein [Gammaproteobacteria bacterium]